MINPAIDLELKKSKQFLYNLKINIKATKAHILILVIINNNKCK